MRRLVSAIPAVLPARFGVVVRDVSHLQFLVKASGISFREALRAVSGREQMTLRVRLVHEQPPRASLRSTAAAGPGRRYLITRLMRTRIPQDRALRALRRQLASLVCNERFQLKDARIATLYHLIERGQSAAYLSRVRAFSKRHPDVQLTASGPFPPYAFAPRLDIAR
jgi:hypothetical protein